MKLQKPVPALSLSALSFPFLANAQQWKYTLNQSDPISGEENKIVDLEVSAKNIGAENPGFGTTTASDNRKFSYKLILSIEKKGQSYFLRYNVFNNARDMNNVTERDTNYLKFSSGKLFKLIALPTAPIYESMGGTTYKIVIPMTKEMVQEMAASNLLFARLGIPGRPNSTIDEKK